MSGMQDVRRYRAQQLARAEYARLQEPVKRGVRRALGGARVHLPEPEFQASYNMAWEALIDRAAQVGVPEHLERWLCVVTYRRAVNYLRRRHSHGESPLDPEEFGTIGDSSELAVGREFVQQILSRIKQRFGERGASIVAHLWLGGLTHAAAAERVGISTKRLRKILYGDGRKVGLKTELARLLEQFGEHADGTPLISPP